MTREAQCPCEVSQNLTEACEMARVAFEDAIAALDIVAEDSYKDPTLFRQCGVSDLSLVLMIAPQVEHESVLRGCVKCFSLTFYQLCSCTLAHVVRTPAHAVTLALAEVLSKRVSHGIESQHSFRLVIVFRVVSRVILVARLLCHHSP